MTASQKSIRRALMIARPRKADGGDVGDGFKEALQEGFGDQPLGLSDETKQQMNTGTPIGAFNRGVVEPAATAADAVLRGANAGVYGLAHVARRAYENVRPHLPESWSQSVGTPEALERDIRDMPNAFMGEINAFPRNAAQTAVDIARKPMAPVERGMVNLGSDGARAAAAMTPEPNYFSALERGIADAKQAKASPQEWKAIASKFPKEEVDWRGLNTFLDQQKGSVTKDQILAHLNDNPVDVKEVWKGGGNDRAIELRKIANTRGMTDAERDELIILEKSGQASEDARSKYHEHVLPGGENYKELLLTLPPNEKRYAYDAFDPRTQQSRKFKTRAEAEAFANQDETGSTVVSEIDAGKDDFRSSHFSEPNILAHVRMNDRTGPDGQKLLHVEELQSDWHQKGKAQGYKDSSSDAQNQAIADAAMKRSMDANAQMEALAKDRDPVTNIMRDEKRWHALARERDAARTEMENASGKLGRTVPDAPFKDTKDWTALAMKRVMRHAADNGYDGVTWTTGAQQADRYDLSKQIGEVHFDPHPRGAGKPISRGDLEVYDHDGKMIMNEESVSTEKLADLIGKDAAKRIIDEPTKRAGNYHILSGDGLRLGGHGMSDYYDKIVPSVARKLGKQYGAEVGKTNLKLPTVEMGKRPIIPQDHVVSTSGGYTVRHPGSENMGLWDTREEAEKWLEDARLYNTEDVQVYHLPITPAMKGKSHKMFQRGGRVDHAPSEAQKAAGNYKKEHIKFQGLDIAIENKKGSTRSGKDATGKAWSCTLPADYGYIKRTEGADGDHVDVYLGPDRSSQQVFIINQADRKTGRFDEHKCMLGYSSERAAVADYCKAFSDGHGMDRLKGIEPVSMDAFKQWLKTGNTKKMATSRNIVDHALKLVQKYAARGSASPSK